LHVNNNRKESYGLAKPAQIGGICVDSSRVLIHDGVMSSGRLSREAYGARLVALRRARGIATAAEAAKAIGVRIQTLQENESGARVAYEPNRLKYGAFYGVHPDTLEPERSITEQSDTELSKESLHPGTADTTVGAPANTPGAISKDDPFGGPAMLRRIGENGYTTVSLFARVLDLYRNDELAVCHAVEACLRDIELNGVQTRPKGRRRSEGAQ
jgi:transcriptional regulator with XRE-family HTH domain